MSRHIFFNCFFTIDYDFVKINLAPFRVGSAGEAFRGWHPSAEQSGEACRTTLRVSSPLSPAPLSRLHLFIAKSLPANKMSLPQKHDPTSYDESEETVPLYTEREDGPAIGEFDDIEAGVELTSLPDEKATADEVREFFVRLLLSSRCNFSRDDARRTAAMWQAGSGREVKSYPAAMYLDLFGKEKGWIIYKEKYVLGQRPKPGQMSKKAKLCEFYLSFASESASSLSLSLS